MRKLFTPAIIVLAAIWLWWNSMPISRPPGVLVREDPVQQAISDVAPFERAGWKLKPLAHYKIKARVLAKSGYYMDWTAKLAPYDLGVGWGRMSDSKVLDGFRFSQVGRFLTWSWSGDTPPIPEAEIESHAANMHLIPDTDSVLSSIRSLRVGSLVYLTGFLVEATPTAMNGAPWRSSMTRTDTGNGACEIMLVRSIKELD